MKKFTLFFLLGGFAYQFSHAEPFKQAEVSRTINNVSLLKGQQAPKPAAPGDIIRGSTAVKTGGDSRAELKFPDETISRIGANALFRFREGGRDMMLEGGAMLFTSPDGAGGGQVQAGAVTAAVTGTNFLVYYLIGGAVKVIVLEGKVVVFLTANSKIFQELGAGESLDIPAGATQLGSPSMADLKLLLANSPLLEAGGFGPLPDQALLVRIANKQNIPKPDNKTDRDLTVVSSDFSSEEAAPEDAPADFDLSKLVAIYENKIALLVNSEEEFSPLIQKATVDPAVVENLRKLADSLGGLTLETLAEAVGLMVKESPQDAPRIVVAAIALLEDLAGKDSPENLVVLAKAALINLPTGEENASNLAALIIGLVVKGLDPKEITAVVQELRTFFLADLPDDKRTDGVVLLDRALVTLGILDPAVVTEDRLAEIQKFLNNPAPDAFVSGDPGVINPGPTGGSAGAGAESQSEAAPTPTPSPAPAS